MRTHLDSDSILTATVGIASPVLGVITSFQEQIEWTLRVASLIVGLMWSHLSDRYGQEDAGEVMGAIRREVLRLGSESRPGTRCTLCFHGFSLFTKQCCSIPQNAFQTVVRVVHILV